MSLAHIEDLGDRLVLTARNGARRNALTPDYYAALTDVLDQARAPRIGAVILRGEGGYFCAGGDLSQIATRRKLPEAERLARVEALHDLIRGIMACPVPIIASVEGGAAGAGVSLAFACDMIVAEESATFSVAYVKAGLVPDGGLTANLARHLPRATLMRLAMLGDTISARRLHDLGAVSFLAPEGRVSEMSMELADRLCRGPRAAQAVIKRLVSDAYGADMATQLDAERDAMAQAAAAPEAGEGITAFLEKRMPDFRKARK